MQNLFTQHNSAESDLNASRWLRAGIIKAAVKWRNSLRQFCKRCLDIGHFSFRQWAKIYCAEFVICLFEEPSRFPFVDIDSVILALMVHLVTRGMPLSVFVSFWFLCDSSVFYLSKEANFWSAILYINETPSETDCDNSSKYVSTSDAINDATFCCCSRIKLENLSDHDLFSCVRSTSSFKNKMILFS